MPCLYPMTFLITSQDVLVVLRPGGIPVRARVTGPDSGIWQQAADAPGGVVLSDIMQAKPATAAHLAVILGCRARFSDPFDLSYSTSHPWRVH
jgi:hypothetical protein